MLKELKIVCSLSAGLCLGGWLTLSLPACRTQSEYFNSKLSVSPTPEVQPGQSVVIYLTGNPPAGTTLKWRVDSGECIPQESSDTKTVYIAPEQLGKDQLQVNVAVEFWLRGKPIGDDSVWITVKRDAAVASPSPATLPPPSAASPSPPATPPAPANGEPAIEITRPGPYEPGGQRLVSDGIEGKVYGVNPADYRVVLYAAAAGQWFIQPYAEGNGRFTPINSKDSTFSNDIHTGVRYAALLVKRSYTDPPPITLSLPELGGEIVAMSVVPGARKP
jgi:hypothetical protein